MMFWKIVLCAACLDVSGVTGFIRQSSDDIVATSSSWKESGNESHPNMPNALKFALKKVGLYRDDHVDISKARMGRREGISAAPNPMEPLLRGGIFDMDMLPKKKSVFARAKTLVGETALIVRDNMKWGVGWAGWRNKKQTLREQAGWADALQDTSNFLDKMKQWVAGTKEVNGEQTEVNLEDWGAEVLGKLDGYSNSAQEATLKFENLRDHFASDEAGGQNVVDAIKKAVNKIPHPGDDAVKHFDIKKCMANPQLCGEFEFAEQAVKEVGNSLSGFGALVAESGKHVRTDLREAFDAVGGAVKGAAADVARTVAAPALSNLHVWDAAETVVTGITGAAAGELVGVSAVNFLFDVKKTVDSEKSLDDMNTYLTEVEESGESKGVEYFTKLCEYNEHKGVKTKVLMQAYDAVYLGLAIAGLFPPAAPIATSIAFVMCALKKLYLFYNLLGGWYRRLFGERRPSCEEKAIANHQVANNFHEATSSNMNLMKLDYEGLKNAITYHETSGEVEEVLDRFCQGWKKFNYCFREDKEEVDEDFPKFRALSERQFSSEGYEYGFDDERTRDACALECALASKRRGKQMCCNYMTKSSLKLVREQYQPGHKTGEYRDYSHDLRETAICHGYAMTSVTGKSYEADPWIWHTDAMDREYLPSNAILCNFWDPEYME